MISRSSQAALAVALLIVGSPWTAGAESIVAGWIENAWLGENSLKIAAKLDTGAKSSSINAPDYVEFERDSARWVRFRVTNADGKGLDIERKIARFVRIKRAGAETVSRPVILSRVCVAGQTADAEFTLADRAGMSYQILIGRTFLADRVLVHSSRKYLGTGRCATQ